MIKNVLSLALAIISAGSVVGMSAKCAPGTTAAPISIAAGAAAGKIESVGAYSDSAASDALKGALEATGTRVMLSDGSAVCDVWLAKGLTLQAKSDTLGALYSVIPDSALVGVITFAKNTTDYRGQSLKAGSYTLRYALHPADGNHLGISPNRDFLLACPVAADKDPAAKLGFPDLVKLSKQASGTNHPAGLSMISTEGQTAFPGTVDDDSGRTVFLGKLKPAGGSELPIALIVKGKADQ